MRFGLLQRLLRSRAVAELFELQTDVLDHFQQLFIGHPHLATIELNHALYVSADAHRKSERPVQTGLVRETLTGKVRVVRDIGDPSGFPARPDTAGQSFVQIEGPLPGLFEKRFGLDSLRPPLVQTTKQRRGAVHAPENSAIPFKILTDGLHDLRHGVFQTA